MSRTVAGFLGAAQFLTRVPIRLGAAPDIARSVPWFPFVGAAIGLAIGVVAAGMMEVVPATVAAAVAVLFGIVLTGAFHEDGLADTADAMGGWTPGQRREILKDPRHGSYGVAALCGSIVLRVVCVAVLGPAVAVAGLVAAHTLGRAGAVGVMAVASRSNRDRMGADGLGAEYMHRLSRTGALIGVAVGVAVTAVATGWWVVPLTICAGISAGVVAGLAGRALGGVNGDVLGAAEQVAECTVLVVVTALTTRHHLWWA